MAAPRLNIPRTWAVIVFSMAIPPLGIGRLLFPHDDIASRLAREAIFWAIAVALVGWVAVVERRPLTSIGFRRPGADSLGFGVLAGVLITALYVIIAGALVPALGLKGDAKAMQGLMATPYWFRILLVARGAVTEEILYRAYPIERVGMLTGSRLAAVAVSVVGFTLAHLQYWGPVQLLFVAPAGLVLAALYVWRRDITCNIIAHVVTDGVGFLARG